ncbi:MAG: peptidoglycan binding protein CsiV [Gammaproteobacteria bacterium]|nr:peptidoglycan binding protein CsiV [Gammaproteobacteria bacterium]
MRLFINRTLILILLQTLSSAVYANETGYEVELIIFEDVQGRYLRSEDWSYNDMLKNTKEIEAKSVKPDPQYKQLVWEGAKLASNLERLQNNSNFRVLVNKRWRQTGLDREHAFNISINTSTLEAEPGVDTPEALETTQIEESFVKGNVKLVMSRYLHFNVNLQYIRPLTNQSNDITDVKNIVLPVVNERRMRSKEVHYIDHPLVGVVVLATPYKIKSKEQDTSNTEYKTM